MDNKLGGFAPIAVRPALYDALRAEGFPIPTYCHDVRLDMTVDGVFTMNFNVFLTAENMSQLGRALAAIGAQQELIAAKKGPIR